MLSLVLTAATGASAQSGDLPRHPRCRVHLNPNLVLGGGPEETRPATTTFFGDTGLWFVPTGEVLDHGKWSVSGYRRGTNYIQGFSNVGDIAGTFAVGIKSRAEIFGRSSSIPAWIATWCRCSSTTRTWAASSIGTRGSTSGGPATTWATSTSAEDQPVVRVPPEAGGARLPRHGEAADRRRRRGRLDRANRISASTSSAARNCGARSSCRGMAATVPGQAGRLRHSGPGPPGGAWGRASRPGPPSAPRSNWSDRCPPKTRRRLTSGLVVGEDGTIPPAARRPRT